MNTISVVIITKNEAHIIAKTLKSLHGLTDDIIIVDSGSTDNTIHIARQFNYVTVIQAEWKGFGATKNIGNNRAKYDWILTLDADEIPDEKIKNNLNALRLPRDGNIVYDISMRLFIGQKELRFGEYGKVHHVKLFNRKYVQWNDNLVHESLQIPKHFIIKKLTGFILHYTMQSFEDYSTKLVKYALLNAEQLYKDGKKATWVKIHVSPSAGFIANYIFRFGFLDGWRGYVAAKLSAFYTFLKYSRLKEIVEELKINN